MNHTPGPWTVREMRGSNLAIHAPAANIDIASVRLMLIRTDDNARRAADAALIAAAPELLAALEAALRHQDGNGIDYKPWADQARAAIARAKGEA